MKRHRRFVSLFLSFVLVIICSFTATASQTELPDNFSNLSVEQRIQWLDQNIPQITEEATRVNGEISLFTDFTDFTSTKKNYYYNEAGSKVVGISVKCDWTANSNFEIESYNVANFSTYIYDNTFTFIDKDITAYYLSDSNVKIYPEATFASPYIGVLLGQNVNLHGSGSISYSPVSSSLDDDSSNMED